MLIVEFNLWIKTLQYYKVVKCFLSPMKYQDGNVEWSKMVEIFSEYWSWVCFRIFSLGKRILNSPLQISRKIFSNTLNPTLNFDLLDVGAFIPPNFHSYKAPWKVVMSKYFYYKPKILIRLWNFNFCNISGRRGKKAGCLLA